MKKEKASVEFKIVGIELLETSLNTPKEKLPDNPVFRFNVNMDYKINSEKKLVIVLCSVSIIQDQNDENELGKLTASCVYNVADLNNFLDKDTNEFRLPTVLVETLNSMTISTVRGVMFGTFKGSFLHNAVLPAIDTRSLAAGN